MDFRRQIVTCLFSMLRLSFETQKVKENYAIFLKKTPGCYGVKHPGVVGIQYQCLTYTLPTSLTLPLSLQHPGK